MKDRPIAIDSISNPTHGSGAWRPPIVRAPEAIESVLQMVEQQLWDIYDPERAIVVAIGGRLGAGKSTLRRELIGAITGKLSCRLRELGSFVIHVRLDDMVKPWEDRVQNDAFFDKVDGDMVQAVEKAIVDGKTVQKYMLAYNDESWRLMVDSHEVAALISSGASVIEERSRILLHSAILTQEYQTRGIISPVSQIYIDITVPRKRYHAIERFNPRGHLVLLEGVSVALNEEAARRYAALLYVFADDTTLRENVILRAAIRYRRHSFKLAKILELSKCDDAGQRYVDDLARMHFTMVVDNSRPLCSADEVLALLKQKASFLARQHHAGEVPWILYALLDRHIEAHITKGEGKMASIIPITRPDIEVEAHMDKVLNRILLHEVLDANDIHALPAIDRDCLRDNIDVYLNTPQTQ